MRLTEEQRKAVREDSEANRPCKACRYMIMERRGKWIVPTCLCPGACGAGHEGWKPLIVNMNEEKEKEMKYTNNVELVGPVSCVYRVKAEQGTELRLAVRTTTSLGWETTVICSYTVPAEAPLPRIRKGMWVHVCGTVRLVPAINGKHQVYVFLPEKPDVVREMSLRAMVNRMTVKGLMHEQNRGNFREPELEAGFLLQAEDPLTGFLYEYVCVVPGFAMEKYLAVRDEGGCIFAVGSLMVLYDSDDEESSACCIITDGMWKSRSFIVRDTGMFSRRGRPCG